MSRNDTCRTENLLVFSYYQNCYKLNGIELSRQTDMNTPQSINFTGKLEEDEGVTLFFIGKSQQKQHKKFL